MNFNYYIPTRILFGENSIEELKKVDLPGKKALIVISSGKSMKKFGYLEKLTGILDSIDIGYEVFDKILPNPIQEHVMEGSKLVKETNCDFVIGLGGGSSIDSAKSIAVMATNKGDYWDYISGGSGKGMKVSNKPLPIVAITTTSGTGTEADPWTVITKTETNEKIGFGYDGTFPTISVVDPNLMKSVPAKLTAFQGLDAFYHASEGYIANIATPISDMYAIKSIELLAKYLPRAVKDGNDMEARTHVALANTISGMVESTSSCTSEHSIAHALSAFHPELPHGGALCSICIEYHKAFLDVAPKRYIQMARAMGNENASKASDFIDSLTKLLDECNVLDMKLSDYGVTNEFEKYANNAKETMMGLFNLDRKELSTSDVVNLLEKSYK